MKWIRKFFNKKTQKPLTESEMFAKMGELGVSPQKMLEFQELTNKIKSFQTE